jgi:choline-sulfatase
MTKRPNILVIMADQLAAQFLPFYGHKVVKAPHLTRLAGSGTVFENCYTGSPLCAPSRFTMMSGRLASMIEAYDNAADFRADTPTFAHALRREGYRTVLAGKMHFCGPDQLHGFEERLTTDIYPADYGWTPDWEKPEVRPSWYHDMLSVSKAGACARSNQIDFDEEVGYSARRHLYDIARGPDERPFFMLVSFTHPHDPYAILPYYFDKYRDDDIDLPAVARLPKEMQDPHSLRVMHVCETDVYEPSEEEIRRARRAYYGAISFIDDQVGILLRTLKECGLDEDTVVVFTADHGDMLGERGMWYKMSFFEAAARIPLVIRLPGGSDQRRVQNNVSLMDLFPTLVGLARGGDDDLGQPIEGKSLLPHLSGGGHDEALGEYLGEGAIAPIFMIRRGRYKFVTTSTDPDQLFDLAADPLERTNLAAGGASAAETALLASLRAEAATRWDSARVHEAVIASQRRRRFVHEALMQGRHRPWDFQPMVDATRAYMRNTIDLPDLERRARMPVREAAPGTGNLTDRKRA